MNDAGHLLATGRLGYANVVGVRFQNQAMHGVPLCSGQLTDVVGGQGKRVAIPVRTERLTIRRELTANSVRVRNQEGRAETVAQVAKCIEIGRDTSELQSLR